MKWDAKWIWSGQTSGKNQWVCFRKNVYLTSTKRASLRITADSRYWVYINGVECSCGPARGWPEHQPVDTIDVTTFLKSGKNTISVLVNYIGESTSQYINGRGGLLAQVEFSDGTKIQTDETWKCKTHAAFQRALCRINVAQPWLEIFDAAAFPPEWNLPEFDDADWEQAQSIGVAGCEPWPGFRERNVPLFAEKIYDAERVMSYADVKHCGFHACVNVRDNFFPGSTDSVDKAFLGYMAVTIRCKKPCMGTIGLVCRKTPEVTERMKLNGKEIHFPIGESTQSMHLNEGDNFLLIDISGYHQRFSMIYHFQFTEEAELRAPWESESPFVTIGPFQKENLLNIVAINSELDFENRIYRQIWEAGVHDRIDVFREWIQAVDLEHCVMENPHVFLLTDRTLCRHDIRPELDCMLRADQTGVRIEPNGNDRQIVLDFGKEVCGEIRFELEAEQGICVDVDTSECWHQGKFELPPDLNSGFRYYTRAGRQTFKSHLRRGFRYLFFTIRNQTVPINIYRICCCAKEYPVAQRGQFVCSDWELNKIWDISARTVFLCMEDTYTDCPAYEQAYWIGDGRIEALVNYYTYGAYALSANSFSLVIPSLERSFLPEAQVPTGCNTVIPLWSILWMLSCLEYYTYSGDKSGTEELFRAVLTTLDRLNTCRNEKGLIELTGWNMFDWADMDTPIRGVITHQNLFLAIVLDKAAKLATVLDKEGEAQELLYRSRNLKKAIQDNLWDTQKGAFIDSIHSDGTRSSVFSAQTNFLAFLCDDTEEEREQRLLELLLDPPEAFVSVGSPFASFFYYEALEKARQAGKIVEDIRTRWGKMLEYGASSCWETFYGFEKDRITRSHCHGWSSAPGYFLPRLILGVKPTKPGFREFVVEPEECGLQWARGSVPTPYGPIEVSWKKHKGKLELSVRKPPECSWVAN